MLDTLVETKGCDVSVTKKYSRMDSPRDSRGLLLLEEVEEQLCEAAAAAAAAFFLLLISPMLVHVCSARWPSRRLLSRHVEAISNIQCTA